MFINSQEGTSIKFGWDFKIYFAFKRSCSV